MQSLTPLTQEELRSLLTRLSQHLESVAEKPSEQLNLLSLWSQYKIAKAKLVAATTQKGDWPEVDRALAAVSPQALEFAASSASLFLKELLERYSGSTTRKVLLYARAANYWAIEEELLIPLLQNHATVASADRI